MMTLSGRYLTLEDGTPTLDDIAVGLSRLPRFVGQTTRPYTVAHHSLVVSDMTILGRGKAEWFGELSMHALFHDAHEMMTGDIPTTFKTLDMRRLQQELDARLYNAFGLPKPRAIHRELVKQYDRQALLAEAYVLTPATTYERICEETESHAETMFIEVVEKRSTETPEEAADDFSAIASVLIGKWGTP